jgi:hypothetical protein
MALRLAYDSGEVSFRCLSYLCLFGVVYLHAFFCRTTWSMDGVLILLLGSVWRYYFLPLSIRHWSLESDHCTCQLIS